MERITALIVDDELPARRGMRKMLQQDPAVELLPDCRDGISAIAAIQQNHPDVVFLDVQMPGMNGFQVLKALDPGALPLIVFVTAYDEYAIEAFGVHALDYLLKPVREERLKMTLERMKAEVAARNEADIHGRLRDFLEDLKEERKSIEKLISKETPREAEVTPDRILVKSSDHMYFVKLDKVDWIEATGDYAKLHTADQVHIIRETMNNLEAKLDSDKFMRIHRSTIVNVDRIAELRPLFAGDYLVVLHNGTKLTLTRTHRTRLDHLLRRFS